MIRSGNPALRPDTFQRAVIAVGASGTMTVHGTVYKGFLLLAILSASAAWSWTNPSMISTSILLGMIGGFIVGLIVIFKKTTAPYLGPVYAGLEGLAVGGISMAFESRYPGIVVQAVGLTFAVFAALLFAYTSRLIKVTENFKLGVVAATGGIAIFYLSGLVLSMFGFHALSALHSVENTSMLSIGISVFVVTIAALALVMDFDFIEEGEKNRCPKYMEWYAAFGLIVTLIWLYLEILRLLAKLQSRK